MLKPTFKLLYESKDITKSIEPYIKSIEYTDFEHGQSDEISIALEDSSNLWKSSWYPSKADKIALSLGYKGKQLLDCGKFEIDEIEFLKIDRSENSSFLSSARSTLASLTFAPSRISLFFR